MSGRVPKPSTPLGLSRQEAATAQLQERVYGEGQSPILNAASAVQEQKGSVQGTLIGRLIESALQQSRSILAIPTGAERLIANALGKVGIDPPRPLEVLQTNTKLAEEVTQETFGIEPNKFLEVVNTLIGAVLGGAAAMKAAGASRPLLTRLLGQRFGSGVFRAINFPQIAAAANRSQKVARSVQAAGLAGTEGALFEAGFFPDSDTKQVAIGGLFGALGGWGFAALQIRKSNKLIKQFDLPDDSPPELLQELLSKNSDLPEEFSSYVASLDAQDELLGPARHIEELLNDQGVASVALTLQELGEKGGVGAVRGIDLTEDAIHELTEAFPNYRFATAVDHQGVKSFLYGLKPELREGKAIGYLTDSAINFYNKNGFLLGQRALLAGQEFSVTGVSKGVQGLKVKLQPPHVEGAASVVTSLDNVAFLDDAATTFGGSDLYSQFINFRSKNTGSWDEVFEKFTKILPDFDPALTRSLRRYLARREGATLKSRIRPDATADLQRFRRAINELHQNAANEGTTLEHLAASRGFMLTRFPRDGRIKITRVQDGMTRPFRDEARAAKFLNDYRVDNGVELTPKIDDVPAEVFDGVAISPGPSNPSMPPDFESRALQRIFSRPTKSSIAEGLFKGPKRIVQLAENRAQEWESFSGIPLFSEGMQPVSLGITRMLAKTFPYFKRLGSVVDQVKPNRRHVIREWLVSELKPNVELSAKMTPKEIQAAESLRLLYNDLFDELSKYANVELSGENFYRNYAPDVFENVRQTGSLETFEQIWKGQGKPLPPEIDYFAEMFKTGELAFFQEDDIFAVTAKTIRSGFFKAEVGPQWHQAVEFTKTIEDVDAQKFLGDWLASQRGFPELSRQEFNAATKEFLDGLGVRLKPAEIEGITNSVFTANIGSLMGFRAGLAMRNLTQPYQLFAPLLPNGFRRVAKAQIKAGTREVAEWATEIGAIRKQAPISRAEIVETIPGATGTKRRRLNQLVNKSLGWYSSADSRNRATVAVAVRDVFDDLAPAFKKGEINYQDLLDHSGLYVQEQSVQNQFLAKLENEGWTEARDYAAREMANFTNFLYGSQNSAKWVRGVPGKFFGNYSTWPMGYLNWSERVLRNANLSQKTRILAKHGLTNAVLFGMKGFRVNLMSWIPFWSLGYTGGPLTQVAVDLWTLGAGTTTQVRGYDPQPDYYMALDRMTNDHWKLFVPGGILFTRDIKRAANRLDENAPMLGILEAVGIRTTDPPEKISPGPVVGIR